MVTIKQKLSINIAAHGRIQIRSIDPNKAKRRERPSGRVPRISRLMALAIHFDELLRTGEVSDMVELADREQVTQPRMSQIMALNQLAPEIQEQLLFLPRLSVGKPEISEKSLRKIIMLEEWEEQRYLFETVFGTPSSDDSDTM
ncbi:hypothetical protein VN12_00165 [Pirellula sp. SH-Sr6A]|uniref:hypothetical protein n=1 Tax=Pirellula sp. SH-Sr6A TaxID=1632865 RepID=UPI00078D81A6|nr:hypothetical protein [Pirellula sp. SH-Sr6A]AMV30495.1 hypothetical protein VN12_00165 [Pirellula sp. SH-Sr6A]